ncbi:MAG: hypothetical protein AAF921_14040 [Cyanobacteria bacterium P01_D01_bin.44]
MLLLSFHGFHGEDSTNELVDFGAMQTRGDHCCWAVAIAFLDFQTAIAAVGKVRSHCLIEVRSRF